MTGTLTFNDIRKYILGLNAKESRERVVKALQEELERQKVRRPWESIEPLIIALYHAVFVDKDVGVGRLLLRYLEEILPNHRIALAQDAREIADIVIYAARTKIGEIDKNNALKYIQSRSTASPISELVKKIAIIEISGEFDETLDEQLRKTISEREARLRLLQEDPSFRDIADRFFLDLDVALTDREPERYTLHGYFIHRAKELQEDYMKGKKYLDQIKREHDELESEYSRHVEETEEILLKGIKVVIVGLGLFAITASLSAILFSLFDMLPGIASGVSSIVLLIFNYVEGLRAAVIQPLISKLAAVIARCRRRGRELKKKIKEKEIVLRNMERLVRRLDKP